MMDNIKSKLPAEVLNAYDTLKSLRDSKDEWVFDFMSDEEYSKLDDMKLGSQILWKEMLNRIYIIVLISCFKSLRWLEAMDSNFNNYYGFCASLRGLVESLADSFYTLQNVPLTIASDFKVIKEQINKSSMFVLIHEKLEAELLHFIQATKLNSEQKEKYPKCFNSKDITDYLGEITDENNRVKSLYSVLCGISHPAYEGTQIFLFSHNNKAIVCSDSYNFEIKMIETLLDGYSDALIHLFKVFMVNMTSVLLVLNEFNIENIYTSVSYEFSFKQTEVWKEIATYMKDSDNKYNEAVKVGRYI